MTFLKDFKEFMEMISNKLLDFKYYHNKSNDFEEIQLFADYESHKIVCEINNIDHCSDFNYFINLPSIVSHRAIPKDYEMLMGIRWLLSKENLLDRNYGLNGDAYLCENDNQVYIKTNDEWVVFMKNNKMGEFFISDIKEG